jgi:hypothetical protein
VQVAVETTSAGVTHPFINRFHVHYTGTAPTSVELASFATTVLTAWGAALAGVSGTDRSFTGLEAIDLSTPTSAQAAVTGAVGGTMGGGILPASACVVMAGKVARRYRGGHPRLYLALGDDTVVDTTRLWDTAWLATVLTAWSGFITALEGAGWAGAGTLAPCNVSYYEGYHLVTYPSLRSRDVPLLRVGGPVVDDITSWVTRVPIGSQRRRMAA